MAATVFKYDEGLGHFATNSFPARQKFKTHQSDTASGAWLVAQHAEQRRHFKAVLCSKPRTFEEIRSQRKKAEKDGTTIAMQQKCQEVHENCDGDTDDDGKVLDGFFLMRHCHISDPSDLCTINVSGQGLVDAVPKDFEIFTNVVHVNAADNLLTLEPFSNFPKLEELEIPVNGLRGIELTSQMFSQLQSLDISFNNLSPADVAALGLLPRLKVLDVSGNNLTSLPVDMCQVVSSSVNKRSGSELRFPALEKLIADDNSLGGNDTVFLALAGLQRLMHLSLQKNDIQAVPHLLVIDGHFIIQTTDDLKPSRRAANDSKHTQRHDKRLTQRGCSQSQLNKRKNKRVEDGNLAPVAVSQQASQAGGWVKDGKSSPATQVEHDAGHLIDDAAEIEKAELANMSRISEHDVMEVEGETTETSSYKERPQTVDMDDDEHMQDLEDRNSVILSDRQKIVRSGMEYSETARTTSTADAKDGVIGLMVEAGDLNAASTGVVDALLPGEGEGDTCLFEFGELDVSDIGVKLSREGKDKSAILAPFSQLHHLNLSHNKISKEESLLALSAWPSLKALLIYDNPLATSASRELPIVNQFLERQLGIHVHCKKPAVAAKPHLEIAKPKAHRRVNSTVPPMPRCNVDELLRAIEAAPVQTAALMPPRSKSASESRTLPSGSGAVLKTPLPPIASSSDTWTDEMLSRRPHTADSLTSTGRHKEQQQPQEPEQPEHFFMTETGDTVEPETASHGGSRDDDGDDGTNRSSESGSSHGDTTVLPVQPDRHIFPDGYELLLDIDESMLDNSLPQPNDILGNVRALSYALSHPLIFRDHRTEPQKPQKLFQPLVRKPDPSVVPIKTKAEKTNAVLTSLKTRDTYTEVPLKDVLSQGRGTKDYTEAKKLMSELQQKYRDVHVEQVSTTRQLLAKLRDRGNVVKPSEAAGIRQ